MPQHDPSGDEPDVTPGPPPAETRTAGGNATAGEAQPTEAQPPPAAEMPPPVPVPVPGVDPDEPPAVPSGKFGTPGRPLRRSSFLLGFTGALGVLLAYTLYLGIRNAGGILVLVVIALFLAVGLNPAVVRLRRWGVPHGLAVAVVALTVVLLLCGGVVALVPPIVTQSGQFIDQIPSLPRRVAPQPDGQRPGGAVRRGGTGAGRGQRGDGRTGARRGARRRTTDLRHGVPDADRAGADHLLPGATSTSCARWATRWCPGRGGSGCS